MARDRGQVAKTKRQLRDLRRLEMRFRGAPDSAPLLWYDYFSLEPGASARYPLVTLSVLDRDSRKRIVEQYLTDVFLTSVGTASAQGLARTHELLEHLGLPPGATDAEVRGRFRSRAKELHPDLGGDADAMAELLRLYSDSPRSR